MNRRRWRRRQQEASRVWVGTFKLVTILFLCAGSFLLHTWLRTRIVTLSYELSDKQLERNLLEAEVIDLKVQRTALHSAAKMESLKKDMKRRGIELENVRSAQLFFLEKEEAE